MLVPPFRHPRSGLSGRWSNATGTGPIPPDPAPTFTHFASPDGGGNGTEGSPFLISDFMALPPTAGDSLGLVDGPYTGANSMITAPVVSGTPEDYISVGAINEGSVLIDGGNARIPINLQSGANYWIVEGVNCKECGDNEQVVRISGNFNIVRRTIAWNAPDTTNGSVFSTIGSHGNLIEDCAAFGDGRRMFNMYESGSSNPLLASNILRRCWGQGKYWSVDTKKVFQIGYQGYNDIAENCIASFDEEGGAAQSGWRGLFCHGRIDHFGIVPANYAGGITDPDYIYDVSSRSAFYGCIGYVLPGQDGDRLENMVDGFGPAAGGNGFKDIVLYSGQDTLNNRFIRAREMYGKQGFITNITEIGAELDSINAEWTVTNKQRYATLGTEPSPFQTSAGDGARVYYRYENGLLTATPLWPWPMDARIKAALTLSGRDPDVVFNGVGNGLTDLMVDLFGAIPGI